MTTFKDHTTHIFSEASQFGPLAVAVPGELAGKDNHDVCMYVALII